MKRSILLENNRREEVTAFRIFEWEGYEFFVHEAHRGKFVVSCSLSGLRLSFTTHRSPEEAQERALERLQAAGVGRFYNSLPPKLRGTPPPNK